jgi:GPH family glycoside/pentoside/hexuronide:cation symporter
MAGYEPNARQPESVLMALRVLYALVPSACNLAALLVALAYPISEPVHRSILSAIERRKNLESVADPLNPGITILPGR